MRTTIILAAMLAGAPAVAQTPAPSTAAPAAAPAASTTNSGVLRRVPLDQWMPERCPNPERQGEIVVCGRPDEEETVPTDPPVPGERGTDVQSERANLIAPEAAAPSISCTPAGPAGESGCARAEMEQWRRERALQKARERAQQPN